jgi:hypothetical protein
MLYLKNTFGGLGRSLTDSAVQAFHGPHRWWKLALYVAMFILPGGSLGVLLIAWLDGRRGKAQPADAATSPAATSATTAAATTAVTTCAARTDVASSRSVASRIARANCEQRA